MEVDAASDDSDATVAGEEDLPSALEVPRLPPSGAGRPLNSSQLSVSGHAQTAAASQPTQSSRVSDGEDTGPVSPSLLHGYAASKSHLEAQEKYSDMEVVPNSSGEGSTCDEEMSQEFAPQTDMTSKATMNQAETKNPIQQQCKEAALSLSSVMQDQQNFVTYLNTLNKPSLALVSEAKKKAATIEENLKTANLSNQTERKKLAAAHNSLLSQCHSQEELSEGSQPLKAQLLQLAMRQKQLLECFKKQKEINLILSKLEETAKTISIGHSNPSQASSVVGVSNVNTEDGKSFLSGVRGKGQVPNPSTLSAALPNLVRHLRQPVERREETLQQNQPTVVAVTSLPSQITGTSMDSGNQFPGISAVSITSTQTRPSHVQQPKSIPSSGSQSMSSNSSGQILPSVNQQLSGGVGGGSVTAAKVPLSSTDLSQPVPLPDLIKHGFIKPGVDCISCVVMGCEFKASLLEDGSIKDHLGTQHQLPQQWFRSCWAKLGHAQKKPSKKSAYTSVLFQGAPLLQFCEKYSLKQVNSYLIEKDKRKSLTQPTNGSSVTSHTSSCIQENCGIPQNTSLTSVTNNVMSNRHAATNEISYPDISVNSFGPLSWVLFGIDDILRNGRMLLHGSSKQTSLELPSDFWSSDYGVQDLSETLCQQFEQDLQW